MNRWHRLERYSRWKQRRLSLERLPRDVLGYVMQHLSHDDAIALINALYGTSPIPVELTGIWSHVRAVDGLRRLVHSIADVAMFHAIHCSYVCAHVDWSIFSRRVPQTLCTYQWTLQHNADVKVNDEHVKRLVSQCLQKKRQAVTIALYRYVVFKTNTFLLHSEPCLQFSYTL